MVLDFDPKKDFVYAEDTLILGVRYLVKEIKNPELTATVTIDDLNKDLDIDDLLKELNIK